MALAELVQVSESSVVSRTIMKNNAGTVTLFAFDSGEGLSEHMAPFDAMVTALEGSATVTISGKPLELVTGNAVIMPANEPHAIKALTPFKMMLVMIRQV
ncbi:MAG: cupin domain-containing protein [Candidatus Wallbacteria bacterium HGW-Wallbacteria-1]|uniref:Cupin domain-containing protein n=1 Tax=Candidatus Wallbacteria bacterium HGW-Wallbacteria-1 TaxID=2013854 RepID=A0A2N1PT84_9BACT|nr:MAG: cupin domain-containing protein [Candidatus Wallbacteria bacterium HGW-Wallbacteria-1]